MKNKLIIISVLSILLLVNIFLISTVKKDATNLKYIPPLQADNLPVSIDVIDMTVATNNADEKRFIKDVILDYLIKYGENSSSLQYNVDTKSVVVSNAANDKKITKFNVQANNTTYSITLENTGDVNLKVTISDGKNTYTSFRSLTPEPSFGGN